MPPLFYSIVGTVFGLIVGSFLATLIVRWPQGQSAIGGRSHCDKCGRQLGLAELVPVISYLVQSGKCKRCGAEITSNHLMIELAAGLIGGLALYVAPGVEGVLGALFGWQLLALAALDAEHHWLPDKLTFLLAITGLLVGLMIAEPDMVARLIGGIAGFASLTLISFGYKFFRGRDGLGGGDPKMLGAIGCWLGWSALPLVLLVAALIGFVAIIGMRLRGEEITGSSELPLGSFMAVAAIPLWLIQTAIGGSLL